MFCEGGCCHGTWWINRPALYRSTSGRFFVMRQSRQAFSSQSEARSELFCGCLHPFPHNMLQLPSGFCLSTGNRRQGASEHLAGRPSSRGSADCHRRSPVSIALGHQLAPSFSRLRQCHSQCCMRAYEMVVGAPPLQMDQ